ncbi:MAG TPA: sulfotransferase, partial [Gammaproteobacteria bacterium]|nr:sulfotransferase [Gammaproteobacteria bacterium]
MDRGTANLPLWRRRAAQSLERGDFAGVERAAHAILRKAGEDADAHYLLGVAKAAVGRFSDAIVELERAVTAAPSRADYRAELARCLSVTRRDEEARSAVEAALALAPRDPLTFDTLGVVLARAGEHVRAAALFRRAAAGAPDNAGFQYNLGSSLRFVGDFAGAEHAFEAAVRLAPRHYRAHSALAEIKCRGPEDNHIPRLLSLLAEVGGDVDGELHLRQALAKEYEDLGDYDAAFVHLAAGRARKRRVLGYSFAADKALFERVADVCSGPFFTSISPGADSAAPIFVVGMPRTGSTLAERILSSHSGVSSAGELQNFPLCLKRAAASSSPRVLEPETIAAAAALDFRALGESYLASTRSLVGSAPRFVDKLPLNFLCIGFIRRALPNARIICMRRHPLDTCVSNFRQLFAVDLPYYRYAFDLNDTADYYVSFHRLIEHWERELPGAVLQVQYERLVTDAAGETRRMLDFCGLQWEDACLEFHANPAPVATASAAQVREPLHSRSIGRWQCYARKLDGVRERLSAAGIDVAI